jgi:hypothetical protein
MSRNLDYISCYFQYTVIPIGGWLGIHYVIQSFQRSFKQDAKVVSLKSGSMKSGIVLKGILSVFLRR